MRIVTDGNLRGGTVRFETYRAVNGRGPHGGDPERATVNRGMGQCVHCREAISAEEIKAQARGESPYGCWTDRLYCVVAVRLEPQLDRNGKPQRYTSGPNRGEIKTRKVRFFRPPNERDLQALKDAEIQLQERWTAWEAEGLIPNERFYRSRQVMTAEHRTITAWLRAGVTCSPRASSGPLTLVEGLNCLKPEILAELGPERGRAVVTYLQFAIDKGLDYNSRQTRWEYTRGIVKEHLVATIFPSNGPLAK